MTHFKLKDIDSVIPIGNDLNWFSLTDGELYLNVENYKLFEYTSQAMQYFDDKTSPYIDYYIARFLEDFTQLFMAIGESIPDHLYELTKNLHYFQENTSKWLSILDKDDDMPSNFYFEEYTSVCSWINNRQLNSSHLIGGPSVYFLRNRDKIRIAWETDQTLDNSIKLWTAKTDSLEMDYIEFVNHVKSFGMGFFKEMTQQVDKALYKDWGQINLDKQKLIQEQIDRELAFQRSISLLIEVKDCQTNWDEIDDLIIQMNTEIA